MIAEEHLNQIMSETGAEYGYERAAEVIRMDWTAIKVNLLNIMVFWKVND